MIIISLFVVKFKEYLINQYIMNGLKKNLGVILVLIGAACMAVPQFMGMLNNTYLWIGFLMIILGILATIALGRSED